MNFLGHLFLSPDNDDVRLANLYGDFVKGSDLSAYPTVIQQGIRLHRSIDHYIDHHPEVINLLHKLYPLLPRVSGIAVDLYFDHLLALNWSDYHSHDLRDFTSNFYKTIHNLPDIYSLEFRYVLSKMEHDDWLYSYRSLDGLNKACQGLSRRIGFDNVLSEAPSVFLKLEAEIAQTFRSYMDDACKHFLTR